MRTLDLREIREKDGFVVYFGGRPNEVDTYTFANALVALSDAFKTINQQVNPGYNLELRLEAVGAGSFKAKIREIPKSLRQVLKFSDQRIIWPILVAWFYAQVLASEDTTIIVKADEVIIERDGDRVIVPREAYDAAQKLPNERVGPPVARAIKAVEADPNVTSLGIMKDLDDNSPPALMIERELFAAVRRKADNEDEGENTRTKPVEAMLGIVKAVFAKSGRKWDFVWNGVKIGATIEDPIFMADVMSRKHTIGAGDAIIAEMEIDQVFDPEAAVWLNTAYRIASVRKFIPGSPKQGELIN